MWYCSPSEEQHEQVPPDEIAAPVQSDLHTIVRADAQSSESDRLAKALDGSKTNVASTGPGSEYWLP
jgi:hypothetical protein